MSSILKKKENFITGAVHKWHPLPGTHHTEQKNKRYISVSGTGATLKMYEIELRVLGYIGMLKSLYRNPMLKNLLSTSNQGFPHLDPTRR